MLVGTADQLTSSTCRAVQNSALKGASEDLTIGCLKDVGCKPTPANLNSVGRTSK